MPRYFNLLKLLLPVSILGCSSNSDKESMVLKEVIKSLEISTENVNKDNKIIHASFQDKIADPATSDKAKYLEPMAKKVSGYSNEMFSYVDEIRGRLKEELNLSKGKNVVEKILFEDNNAIQLIDKLNQHKENLFNIDSGVRSSFKGYINFFNGDTNSLNQTSKEIADYYFGNCTLLESLALLTKLENSIRVYENRIIAYLHNRATWYRGHDIFYALLFSINKSYVKPGDQIEITSGVTAFEWFQESEFIINGEKFTEKGIIKHKFYASKKVGKHFLPVEVSYLDQDEKKMVFQKNIEYEVYDCKN